MEPNTPNCTPAAVVDPATLEKTLPVRYADAITKGSIVEKGPGIALRPTCNGENFAFPSNAIVETCPKVLAAAPVRLVLITAEDTAANGFKAPVLAPIAPPSNVELNKSQPD